MGLQGQLSMKYTRAAPISPKSRTKPPRLQLRGISMEAERDSSPDPDDTATLAELLRLRPRPTKKTPLSRLKTFKKGDLIWAKSSRYTWWPGTITRLNKSSALVSLFGRHRSCWLPASQLLPFEENYSSMVETVGTTLCDEVSLALEELSYRSALALMCPCRCSTEKSIGVESVFEPVEMLNFVLGVAVSAWIDEEGVARAVRLSSKINAYRHYVSVCHSTELGEAFHPEEILCFVLGAAVSPSIDVEENGSRDKVARHLNIYRRFVRLRPDWVYRQDMGIEDSWLEEESEDGWIEESKGSDQEMSSDPSCGTQKPCDVIEKVGADIFTSMNDEDVEIFQEQVQDGRDICVLNREDFSILEEDEKYESHDSADVSVWDVSVGADSHMNEKIGQKNLCGGSSAKESDVEVAFPNSFSLSVDVGQTGDFVNGFNPSEGSIESVVCYVTNHLQEEKAYHQVSDPVVWSGNDVVSSCILETTCQGEKINLHGSSADKYNINDSVILSLSSELLPKTAPWLERQIPGSLDHKCDTHSQKEMLRHDAKSPSSHDVNHIVNSSHGRQSDMINDGSSLSISFNTSCESCPQKRRLGWSTTNSFKLQKVLALESEVIAHMSPSMEYLSSAGYETLSNDAAIIANDITVKSSVVVNSGNNIMKFHCAEELSDVQNANIKMEGNTKTSFSSSDSFHHQNGRHQSFASSFSKWDGLYASPLAKDGLKSKCEEQKSLMTGRHSNLPKSLHMKFPKDFNLPSKERLEKKFRVFGPLDHTRTKVFFYTGAAQVVFLHQSDADVAYKYVRRKNLFGQANVRFWLDEYENSRKGHKPLDLFASGVRHSSLNLKSCLKIPKALQEKNQKKVHRVRFMTPK